MSRGKLIKAAEGQHRAPVRPRAPEGTRVIRVGEQRSALESEALLAKAREHAARLMEQAAAEASTLRAEKLAAAEKEAVALLLDARREARHVVAEAQRGLEKLALAAAEKIIGDELMMRPEAVEAVVARVIAAAGQARRLRVRVHPEDLSLLEHARQRLISEEGQLLELIADPEIGRGGCVLESESGEVDGRLETQLAALAELLSAGGRDR